MRYRTSSCWSTITGIWTRHLTRSSGSNSIPWISLASTRFKPRTTCPSHRWIRTKEPRSLRSRWKRIKLTWVSPIKIILHYHHLWPGIQTGITSNTSAYIDCGTTDILWTATKRTHWVWAKATSFGQRVKMRQADIVKRDEMEDAGSGLQLSQHTGWIGSVGKC